MKEPTIQLIKLQDKFVLVSDEAIRQGDLMLNNNTIIEARNDTLVNCTGVNGEKCYKIISENPDFSLLSEKDCKIIGFIDVEKLAEIEANK